jgi:hypothetical protein
MALSEFGKAFSEARKSGLKTFEFKGKKYTTNLAGDSEASSLKPNVRVPRDSSMRAGERAKSEGYVPRDSDTMRGPRMTSANYVGRGGVGGGAGRGIQGGATVEQLLEPVRGSDEMSDMTYKRGGKIKKMANGGSASSRADGIAQRGKTRGKMC